MTTQQDLLAVLQRFAATMSRPYEMNDMLYELGESAVRVLDASGAGVSVVDGDGCLKFVMATNAAVVAIECAQEAFQEGPSVDAFTSGEVVTVAEISELDRWPAYRQAAADGGFVAVVGIPLGSSGDQLGSLNVYDTRPRHWSGTELETARVLADIATGYILRAGKLAEVRRLSEQLQDALDSRIVIEQAKGMLARDHGISVDAAFDLLRGHARRNRVPLRGVATAVVEMAVQIPATPDHGWAPRSSAGSRRVESVVVRRVEPRHHRQTRTVVGDPRGPRRRHVIWAPSQVRRHVIRAPSQVRRQGEVDEVVELAEVEHLGRATR